ncbi:MAG: hypothetical protein GY846_14745 [Deltaproteobacteria bacterium]|nr:hypothetical protein [Deltaproteobacteria bacterium]
MSPEKIITKSGTQLLVEKRVTEKGTEVSLRCEKPVKCLLHWGFCHHIHATWQVPPRALWPEGSRAFDKTAIQTPFLERNGAPKIIFGLDQKSDFPLLVFVLFFPEEDRWDNNHGQNYLIEIPQTRRSSLSPAHALKEEIRDETISYEHVHHMENHYQLAVAVSKNDTPDHVTLITDMPGPLMLHWGLAKRSPYEWSLPPASICPVGTTMFQNKSAETPFDDRKGLRRLQIKMSEHETAIGISFVLRHVDTGRWFKDHGRNFHIPLIAPSKHETSIDSGLAGPAEEIIEKEMNSNSWTLMHRFNLCYDLLEKIGKDTDALALIFIWLRFSAIRQLDWQRNYNTQPRELSHAQDRLTARLAEHYISKPGGGQLIRLILTTLGRGGEGQRIRDEILNIMHRHRIKEVSGHFTEEWHQKLHNNTTPDDVVICEAYLAFLSDNGNLNLFYRRLEEGGVTKQRLESYDRPIRSHPDFIPHLKDALIHDFQEFLGILKSVHSGTDLGTAIHNARHFLDQDLHELMDFVWWHRDDGLAEICTLVEKITEARRRLNERLGKHPDGVRDLLFLDLALEDFLRIVVERNLHLKLRKNQLVDLIALMLENRSFTDDDEELSQCRRHWEILRKTPRFGKKWSVQAQAVVERLGRVLGGFIDRYYSLLQPKAEFLGNAFQADSWTITLFTEEVVRGRPAFVLVMLLRHLNPILRKSADLGDWQVVSRGQGLGQVEVTDSLGAVQNKSYDHSTVIVTDKIGGDEEIPQGITAIITPDTTDIVSHVAIRARNAHVLIATCYDPETVNRLKSLRGQKIKLDVNTAGEVIFEQGTGEIDLSSPNIPRVCIPAHKPAFTVYALPEKDFNEKNVGGKSNNLKRLRRKIPEWIGVPGSAALPFGVFERVLAEKKNKEIAGHYKEMTGKVDKSAGESVNELLDRLRKTVLALEPPDELFPSLYRVMKAAGLALPKNQDKAWMCIKRVWGSKWNERAYLSRRAQGIPHEALFMAVLVQEVVEADYSFVIHTVNPFTHNKNEIYAEAVPGLGETLVGNHPGRAFSFCLKKRGKKPLILAFPSKSIGLFGKGLIFRSDSNGEDLIDYAGAGLYDSVMLTPPGEIVLDYSKEPLVWDESFQRDFATTVARIGTTIEKNMGFPQDIEGACSGGRYYVVQTRPQV